jgi:signal transduction histidine kinase
MKYRIIILLMLIASARGTVFAEITPVAHKGVIDLRKIENEEKFTVKLNGEWDFYWDKLLHPGDFVLPERYKPDLYGKVPSYWTEYKSPGLKITRMGYATYRLKVLLPPGFRNLLGFDMPVFDSSYEIYVDGTLKSSNGKPGTTEAETKPGYSRNFFRYNPSSDSMIILINVSNFHHRRGGFWIPIKMGTFAEVQKRLAASWAIDWSSASLLLGFSLFFLFFFIVYPKDHITGFFSLAAGGLALRPFFTSNFLIYNVINLSWTWVVKCEYIGLYIALAGWYWFTLNLYPSKLFRKIAMVITYLFSVLFLATLFLPVKIFSYFTYLYYPALIVLIVYALEKNIKGIISKNLVDYIYFLTFLMLSIAAIHDVRVALGKEINPPGYILSFVLVFFVFVQAIMLLYKWVKSYSEKEKLQDDLKFLNRNLEIMVNERTQEINKRKEEIEKQNAKIAFQNKQLSETIQLKNKIFSVIAHDLRSPVVNILYMLNLLKEDEYKEKYDTFANASIQYAQQVINLLENMLVWGKGQEDKIKFSPERRDLSDIILTNLSIFKESADKKDISVNFTQIGNSKAYFDKDLMDIIIRNLLSNAVKYTHRGGRISILLKDKTLTNEGIVLKICDNGIGIPPGKQKYLFTASEVESMPGTENEKGTGFGLKLCYELVKINNGTITIDSNEGQGTCFSIALPEDKPI